MSNQAPRVNWMFVISLVAVVDQGASCEDSAAVPAQPAIVARASRLEEYEEVGALYWTKIKTAATDEVLRLTQDPDVSLAAQAKWEALERNVTEGQPCSPTELDEFCSHLKDKAGISVPKIWRDFLATGVQGGNGLAFPEPQPVDGIPYLVSLERPLKWSKDGKRRFYIDLPAEPGDYGMMGHETLRGVHGATLLANSADDSLVAVLTGGSIGWYGYGDGASLSVRSQGEHEWTADVWGNKSRVRRPYFEEFEPDSRQEFLWVGVSYVDGADHVLICGGDKNVAFIEAFQSDNGTAKLRFLTSAYQTEALPDVGR